MITIQHYTNKLMDLNFKYYVEDSKLTNPYFKKESFVRHLKRNFKLTTMGLFQIEIENFVTKAQSRILKNPITSSNSYYSCLVSDPSEGEFIKNDYLRSQFNREKFKIFRELYSSIYNQIFFVRQLQNAS